MSDDRDDGDATDGGAGDVTAKTPLVNRPQRPTGKRSRQGSGAVALAEPEEVEEALTEQFEAVESPGKKKTGPGKGKKTQTGSTRNPLVFVWTYLRQVITEMRKVIWPSRKQMANYTVVVLVFLAFMIALIGLVDLGLAKLVLMVLG